MRVAIRQCEICGTAFIEEYGYAMGASWHVTGHHSVPSFNCQTEPSAQHWGCIPEHAMQALIRCLQHDEHMSVGLMKKKHAEAAGLGLPKIAPEHQDLYRRRGPNFHIVKPEEML